MMLYDTPRKGSIVVTDKSTDGFDVLINGPMTMAADVAIHIKGSPNTLWMTLRTECWEYYKKPEIGIKRTGNMQALDILMKVAKGEYKSYEIKFNYHVSDASDSIRRVVDEVYIKYEEKEKEDNMRYIYKTFEKVATKVDWVNSNAEISTTAGNTYTFDEATDICLESTNGSLNFDKITFADAAKVLLHNNPDILSISAVIPTISTHIVRMKIWVDEESELQKLKEENERLRDNIGKQKALLNTMYGTSALGWSDMWPTSMIDTGTDAKRVWPVENPALRALIPSRQNGKMARLKEFVKKCNLTVPECLYCMNDIAATKKIHDSEKEKEEMKFLVPKIKKVLYNEPAVIVFWEDDTKTVVRAQDGEPYDKEKGLAMAISKKALGNDRNYYETFIRSKAVPKPKKVKKKDKKE